MNTTREIETAVTTRARVRITEGNGFHKGVTGIALGYQSTYDSIKVGFIDANGNYTGDYTVVPVRHVEVIETPAAPGSPAASPLASFPASARKATIRALAAIRAAVQVSRATLTAALTSLTGSVRHTARTFGFTPAQANSALELIEDGAIHPLRNRIWLTVSTDGTRTHRTTTNRCTCEAGIKGGRCYHQLAALVTEAA